VSRLEFNENIHITVWAQVIAQHRTEQSKPSNVMATAEVSDFGLR